MRRIPKQEILILGFTKQCPNLELSTDKVAAGNLLAACPNPSEETK
tara:strand:+ start:66 stop:203 length:138 start_codon:yes stop_codon:yes gene_type:complete